MAVDNSELLNLISSEIKIIKPESKESDLNYLSDNVIEIFNSINESAMETKDVTSDMVALCLKMIDKMDKLNKSSKELYYTYDDIITSTDKLSMTIKSKLSNSISDLDNYSGRVLHDINENVSSSKSKLAEMSDSLVKNMNNINERVISVFTNTSTYFDRMFNRVSKPLDKMNNTFGSKSEIDKGKNRSKEEKLIDAGIIDMTLSERDVLTRSAAGISAFWLFKQLSRVGERGGFIASKITNESESGLADKFVGLVVIKEVMDLLGKFKNKLALIIPALGRIVLPATGIAIAFKVAQERIEKFNVSGKTVELILGVDKATKIQEGIVKTSAVVAGDVGSGSIGERAQNSAINAIISGTIGGLMGAMAGPAGAMLGAKLGVAIGASTGWAGAEDLARALNTSWELMKGLGKITKETFINAKEKAVDFAVSIKDHVIDSFIKAKNKVVDFSISVKDFMVNSFISAKNKVSEITANIRDSIVNSFTVVKEKLNVVLLPIGGFIADKFVVIKEKLDPVLSSISSFIVDKFVKVKEKLAPVLNNISDNISNMFNNVKERLSPILSSISSFIVNKFIETKEKISELQSSEAASVLGTTGTKNLGKEITDIVEENRVKNKIDIDKIEKERKQQETIRNEILENDIVVSKILFEGTGALSTKLDTNTDVLKNLIDKLEKFSIAVGIGSFTKNPGQYFNTVGSDIELNLEAIREFQRKKGLSKEEISVQMTELNNFLRALDVVKQEFPDMNKALLFRQAWHETGGFLQLASDYNYWGAKYPDSDYFKSFTSGFEEQFNNLEGGRSKYSKFADPESSIRYRMELENRYNKYYHKPMSEMGLWDWVTAQKKGGYFGDTTKNYGAGLINAGKYFNISNDTPESANLTIPITSKAEAAGKIKVEENIQNAEIIKSNRELSEKIEKNTKAIIDINKKPVEGGASNTSPMSPEHIPWNILQYIFGINSSGTDSKTYPGSIRCF